MNRGDWGGLRSASIADWPEPEPHSGAVQGAHFGRVALRMDERPPRLEVVLDLTCLVAVAVAWWLVPAGHAAKPGPAAVAVSAYVLGALIRLPAGRGYGAAT